MVKNRVASFRAICFFVVNKNIDVVMFRLYSNSGNVISIKRKSLSY
jgi:hypothetical protein